MLTAVRSFDSAQDWGALIFLDKNSPVLRYVLSHRAFFMPMP